MSTITPDSVTPDAIVIRPATPDDYPAIAELTVEAYEADGHLTDENGYRETLADVAGRASSGEILVAAAGSEVLGAVLFLPTRDRRTPRSLGPGRRSSACSRSPPGRSGAGSGNGSSGPASTGPGPPAPRQW